MITKINDFKSINESSNTGYYIYPYMDDESATIAHPQQQSEVIYGDINQTHVTLDQYKKMVEECGEDISEITDIDQEFFEEDCGYYMSNIALVPIKYLNRNIKYCNKVWDNMPGNDSGIYRTVSEFTDYILSLPGVKVIDFYPE